MLNKHALSFVERAAMPALELRQAGQRRSICLNRSTHSLDRLGVLIVRTSLRRSQDWTSLLEHPVW